MTHAAEGHLIAEAIRTTYDQAGLRWPPRTGGPVPLDRLIAGDALTHDEVSGLDRATASAYLRRWGVEWAEIPDPDPPLAGFLYANAVGGYLLVRREDPLPRRRFSAAHELGHYRLHLAPALALASGPLIKADAKGAISEEAAESLETIERQANRFAAELLMPEAVCRELVDRHASAYGAVSRFLIHQIANDLLVSREAIAWRLSTLRLIDEMPRWLPGHQGEHAAAGKSS